MNDELERAKALSIETKRLEDELRKAGISEMRVSDTVLPKPDSPKLVLPKPEPRKELRTPLKKLLEDDSLDELPRPQASSALKLFCTSFIFLS